ncbi:hypothetical protein pb186bvf_010143 [Paramecium bursaria]
MISQVYFLILQIIFIFKAPKEPNRAEKNLKVAKEHKQIKKNKLKRPQNDSQILKQLIEPQSSKTNQMSLFELSDIFFLKILFEVSNEDLLIVIDTKEWWQPKKIMANQLQQNNCALHNPHVGFHEGIVQCTIIQKMDIQKMGYPKNGYPKNGYPKNGYPKMGYPKNGYQKN